MRSVPELRQLLHSREIRVLIRITVVDPLLGEDIANEFDCVLPVEILDLKAVVLDPLPIVVELRILVDLI